MQHKTSTECPNIKRIIDNFCHTSSFKTIKCQVSRTCTSSINILHQSYEIFNPKLKSDSIFYSDYWYLTFYPSIFCAYFIFIILAIFFLCNHVRFPHHIVSVYISFDHESEHFIFITP